MNLDEELNELSFNHNEEIEFNIEKEINKRIRKIAVKVCAIFMGIILLIFLVISPIMNACYTNPVKLNAEPNRQLLSTLRTYAEVVYPYTEIAEVEVTKKGFSRYTLNLTGIDFTEPITLGMPNIKAQMVRGKLEITEDPNHLTTVLGNRFDQDMDMDALKDEIKKLPNSCYLNLSIEDRKQRTLTDLKKEPVRIDWIQVYQPQVEFEGGLSLNVCCLFKKTDDRHDMTEKQLIDVYIKNLQELIDTYYIWSDLGINSGNTFYNEPLSLLADSIKDAKQMQSLETKNYCIYGSKEDILNFLETYQPNSVYVDKVRLSSL